MPSSDAMKVWTAIKRLDSRSSEWARRAVERAIAYLDQPSNGKKQPANKHIGIRDLLAGGRGRGR